MTGPYLSFKGKLKVGDRVKLRTCTSTYEVTSFDDSGFSVKRVSTPRIGNLGYEWIGWKAGGTLELLSPSPRVVTLKVGDEVSLKGVVWALHDSEGKSVQVKAFGEYIDMPSESALPVQTASPPAPEEKEEEWWKGYAHSSSNLDIDDYAWSANREEVEAIVAEAKRRGADGAWEAARKLVASRDEIISDLLKAIGKPAGAGEK